MLFTIFFLPSRAITFEVQVIRPNIRTNSIAITIICLCNLAAYSLFILSCKAEVLLIVPFDVMFDIG